MKLPRSDAVLSILVGKRDGGFPPEACTNDIFGGVDKINRLDHFRRDIVQLD